MIEDLIIKSALGYKLDDYEINIIEDSFRENPDLIGDYILLKNYLSVKKKEDIESIDDSIFIMKKSKKVFSTLKLLQQTFEQVKAAAIVDSYCRFSLNLNWNSLDLDIYSDIGSYQLTIKSLEDQSDILLKDSQTELFHIILSKDRDFSYSFSSSNVILSCNGKNLALFFSDL
jgi:hypothetical protein